MFPITFFSSLLPNHKELAVDIARECGILVRSAYKDTTGAIQFKGFVSTYYPYPPQHIYMLNDNKYFYVLLFVFIFLFSL